jgi:hypothetical protein
MSWRIDEQVIRGEIDNRSPGKTTGTLWLAGASEPIRLHLDGNPWADLAGHLLRFTNPQPVATGSAMLDADQSGLVGDMTASRKVRVPDCSIEEMMRAAKAGQNYPWHWANCLYLEWFSHRNGRVVIETTSYELEIDAEAAWTMTADDEVRQRAQNAEALSRFVNQLTSAAGFDPHAGLDEVDDDDAPQSAAEAEAQRETDWMNQLLDRVDARLEREGIDIDEYDTIYMEERERLRQETGYPPEDDGPPRSEEEEQAWIDEMNAITAEAMDDMAAEAWKDPDETQRPELLDRAMDLGIRLHRDIEAWLPADATGEHPLREIVWGVQFGSVKIGGALGHDDDEEWPPDPLFAGDTLVRLKKARDHLRDALRGLDSADAENLATPEWRISTRREVSEILGEVQQLIGEVRAVLKEDDEG